MDIATHEEREVTFVADFIEARGQHFHSAFAMPSELNKSTMQYEREEVRDLRETLERHHQIASKYVDFTSDLSKCTWNDVIEELRKAKIKVAESEKRGKTLIHKTWRAMGNTSSILAPGLSALPDELSVLHGGLAVVFSVRSI